MEHGSLAMGWMVRRKEVAFQCPSLTALLLGKLTGQQFLRQQVILVPGT